MLKRLWAPLMIVGGLIAYAYAQTYLGTARIINVRDFGASASNQTTTGTITSGQATLALAAATDFTNTQGIRVNHAGAAFATNPPTGAGVANIGAAGAVTYTYTIASLDVAGGVGAAVANFTTATGNATLNTTNFNRLTWVAPGAGPAPAGYAIYGRIGGSLTLIGLSTDTTYDDYGSAFANLPDWIPSTPPGAALADWLQTTISSGGGTTSLTLAASATTTATTQTVAHNDAPSIQAAVNQANALGGGAVRVPAGYFNLSSQVVVPRQVTLLCETASNNIFNFENVNYGVIDGAVWAVQWGTGAGASDDPTKAAFQLGAGSGVEGCGFWYPYQSNAASRPVAYGASVLIFDNNRNVNQRAVKNWCLNCYSFLDWRGSVSGVGTAGMYLEGNFGAPIFRGIQMNFFIDWFEVINNHFNSGAIFGTDPTPAAHLRGWIAANGNAYYIGRGAFPTLVNNQNWGYLVGVNIDMATNCCTGIAAGSQVSLIGHQTDATFAPITFNGTLQSLTVNGGLFTAFNPYTNAQGAVISNANNTTLTGGLQVNGIFVFGPTQNVVSFAQGTQTIGDVSITNVHAASQGSSDVAYQITSANSLKITASKESGFTGLYNTGGTFTTKPYVEGNTPAQPWLAFTPSVTCGTATITTNSARAKFLDKTTFVELDFTISVLGTCGANSPSFTLPTTANSAAVMSGQEIVNSGNGIACNVTAGSANMATCRKSTAAAYVVNDRVVLTGLYENQ